MYISWLSLCPALKVMPSYAWLEGHSWKASWTNNSGLTRQTNLLWNSGAPNFNVLRPIWGKAVRVTQKPRELSFFFVCPFEDRRFHSVSPTLSLATLTQGHNGKALILSWARGRQALNRVDLAAEVWIRSQELLNQEKLPAPSGLTTPSALKWSKEIKVLKTKKTAELIFISLASQEVDGRRRDPKQEGNFSLPKRWQFAFVFGSGAPLYLNPEV